MEKPKKKRKVNDENVLKALKKTYTITKTMVIKDKLMVLFIAYH